MRYFLLLAAAAGIAVAQSNPGLLGRWRSVETSTGGIGAMYEFRADGTVLFSPGAIVPDMPRPDADTLIWNGDDEFRIKGDQATFGAFRRAGARRDPQSKIVGEWVGSRDMGGHPNEVRFIFGSDGSSLFLQKFLTQRGTYKAAGGKITAIFNGKVGLEGTFSIARDALAIVRSQGRVTRLARY